ncbi:ABC transporter, ATP-binding protein [Stappia aggregata IAM 12614]|uniref:ABC transporter, ATP-binding protein n=1 Tax=Roseibium aggregatum (strain ATCC 25650 / DSM 13394 / JCM 20685 / NBRC 16684 / NCIMB 2208 / IAM 12614 / B1) TaxID=384765 RepID=A0NUD3_ROSAI|nr:ABC transporter, ATP-binding protein [Stappia aggregata IAM 12614] [Roseibium aggregatum IAM 12614]
MSIQNLAYRWPRAEHDTLQIEKLSLETGESVFLYGPSGCGKSTLLSAIAGVIDIPKGVLHVNEQDLSSLHGGARDRFRVDHIGLIFQVFNLIPWLSALENVLLPCTYSQRRRERAGGKSVETAKRLLDELGLSTPALASKKANELSVGQQQRIAAARALIGRPDLILADEPTSALDETAKAAFVDLLTRECAAAGSALLFVSHDRSLEHHFDRSIDFQDLNRSALP